jgi:TorA maturation chaperone TorD
LGRAHAALAAAARATNQDRASAEYFNLFVGVGRGDVVPYASFYRTGFLHARPLSHMRADLARLGVERTNDVFEPEDHLGTMFEVMAGLIQGDFSPADTDAAAQFFKEHIAPWGERLLEDIALAPSSDFYRAVAELGRLWLEIETESFALPE